MAQLKPHGDSNYYLWEYLPSRPAAILFVVLFFLSTSYVVWQSIRTRTRFSIPFIIGGVFELVGYCGRAAALEQTDKLGPYIIQAILILIAPALFAASIYMTLGRLMRSIHGERHSLVPVRWLTRAFVTGDVFSFIVQASGGGLMAVQSFDRGSAENIVLAGLFIQIVMFGLFAATAAVFHVRMRRWPSAASADPAATWPRTMGMLYAVSALIMARSIFRVVEYIMGYGSYPLKNEWTLYVFDAALMFLTVACFGFWYPGRLTPKRREWEDELEAAPGGDAARPGLEERRGGLGGKARK